MWQNISALFYLPDANLCVHICECECSMFWIVLTYGLKENLFWCSLCTGATCEMQQLSSVDVPGGWCMEIWSLTVYVCVCLSLSLPISLFLNDKMGTDSSRWAYSHPRILRWGSRFGWGRSRRPYQKPGEQQQQQKKKPQLHKRTPQSEKKLSFKAKTCFLCLL